MVLQVLLALCDVPSEHIRRTAVSNDRLWGKCFLGCMRFFSSSATLLN